MELSPRTAEGPSAPSTAKRRRSPWAYGLLIAVLVAVGVVAYRGLTEASLYFYNADEVVEQADELAGERIRVQGLVRDDVTSTAFGDGTEGITFTITFNGVDLAVEHRGDPPELFDPGTPVVLEGELSSSPEVFMSDEIIVKHDEEYEADNGDRIADAEDGESGETPDP